MGSLYSVNKKLVGLVLKKEGTAQQVARHAAPQVAQVAAKHAMPRKAASFLQLSSHHGAAPQKLLDFLDQRAAALHSSSLGQLAAVARLSDDPFVKVRGL